MHQPEPSLGSMVRFFLSSAREMGKAIGFCSFSAGKPKPVAWFEAGRCFRIPRLPACNCFLQKPSGPGRGSRRSRPPAGPRHDPGKSGRWRDPRRHPLPGCRGGCATLDPASDGLELGHHVYHKGLTAETRLHSHHQDHATQPRGGNVARPECRASVPERNGRPGPGAQAIRMPSGVSDSNGLREWMRQLFAETLHIADGPVNRDGRPGA